MVRGWTQMVYIFIYWQGNKLTPVYDGFEIGARWLA
jgi:hypothetical protein